MTPCVFRGQCVRLRIALEAMTPMLTARERTSDELRHFRVIRPGLSLHFGTEVQCEESVGNAVVHDNIRIVLLLEGVIDVSYGRSHIQLFTPHLPDRGQRGQKQDAAIVTIREPEECRRVVRQGDSSRRISIGLSKQWLEESLCEGIGDEAVYPLGDHLDTRIWNVSPRARMLAEQMFHPPSMPHHIAGMYLESRAIELIVEALSVTSSTSVHAPSADTMRPKTFQRMRDLKAWLCENSSASLNIDQIARHMNTTATTLQRHFRMAYGQTVFEFLQCQRLRQARQALECDDSSVEQAATLAGYTNAASFATAFKRQFGLTPTQVRPGRR
ncbi:HTH araC/xylS-type domain-containing protein [Bordetella tumbae]